MVEADESDRSFLRLSPEVAVLTNLDEEHLDAYAGMADLEGAFLRFAEQVPARGCIVAGGAIPGCGGCCRACWTAPRAAAST